ncbi:PTS sugar transporter subunit IIA [Lactobacillus sp. B4005]|uniref:PTS sugar transporter subunit IIA n=1 Tax=Lactobacillus sp. B4005 TaxID=2818031 RepID=UPI00226A2A4C|nr:PTS mannose transporter subunit IIA [Lactobacillus sp. B4005]MCX8724318.1 PTS mannose transporter subunit IIA [Lactobacillus sp. B4005]
MTKIVIATHGYLAKGLKMSTEFILGKQKNLFAICAYTSECQDFHKVVKDLIAKYDQEDIIFGTDIVGGSVNNDLQEFVAGNNRLHLVAGINLPFLIQFLTLNNDNVADNLAKSTQAAKSGIVNYDTLDDTIQTDELDGFDSF